MCQQNKSKLAANFLVSFKNMTKFYNLCIKIQNFILFFIQLFKFLGANVLYMIVHIIEIESHLIARFSNFQKCQNKESPNKTSIFILKCIAIQKRLKPAYERLSLRKQHIHHAKTHIIMDSQFQNSNKVPIIFYLKYLISFFQIKFIQIIIQKINQIYQIMKAFAFLLIVLPFVSSFTCQFCIQLTQALQSTILYLAPQSFVQQAVFQVCQRKYDSQQLCKHVTEELTPLAMQSGVKGILKQGRICQNFCGKDFYQTFDMKNIEHSLEILPQDNISQPLFQKIVLKNQDFANLRVLHLTDIHLDLNYTQKSSTACSLPICCHISNGFPQTKSTQALPLGSIKCDTPMKLLHKALNYIEQNIKQIDIVIITGDYSAHNEWEKTSESVQYVRQLVEEKIRQKVGVKYVFTSPGNNQYLPDHQVDPSGAQDQSLKVYRVYQEDQQKYLTFVSINTLFCDSMNLYLIQDQTGPLRQLKLLDKVLSENQNVYLMGHIGLTTDSCSSTYSQIFRTIVTKHKEKILGQFYGHTHLDQFMVNTNPKNNSQQISYAFSGGSISPLGTGTSRFRVYELNTITFRPTNYLDYQLRLLDEQFSLNYEFKKFYQINNMDITPTIMKQLQQRMQNDVDLRKKYAGQLNGNHIGTNQLAYCDTYDDKSTKDKCKGTSLTFSMQINQLLQIVQGPWGSYGDVVQK